MKRWSYFMSMKIETVHKREANKIWLQCFGPMRCIRIHATTSIFTVAKVSRRVRKTIFHLEAGLCYKSWKLCQIHCNNVYSLTIYLQITNNWLTSETLDMKQPELWWKTDSKIPSDIAKANEKRTKTVLRLQAGRLQWSPYCQVVRQ